MNKKAAREEITPHEFRKGPETPAHPRESTDRGWGQTEG